MKPEVPTDPSHPAVGSVEPKHERGPALLLIAGVIVIIVVLIVGILPRLKQRAALADGVKAVKSTLPEVTVVKPKWVSDPGVTLPGNVQAIKATAINARTTGFLKELNVDIGSKVTAGQVLGIIESPDVDQQYVQAKAQTVQSVATVQQSNANVAQQQSMVAQAKSEVARQRFALQQARQAVSTAQAQLAQSVAGEKGATSALSHAKQALIAQQATYQGAAAQLNLAKVTNDRYQSLLKQKFVAQQDADQAEATYKVDVAALDSAKAAIDAAQADVATAVQTVASARSGITASEANVKSSQENVSAAEQSLVSAQDAVDAAVHAVTANIETVHANKAAVASNEANARRYDVMRGFEKVLAPFSGVITARNVDVGTLISAGGTETGVTTPAPASGMLGIARTDVVRIQINVPQTYVPAISEGSVTKITVRELPGKVFTGKTIIRAGALDTTSRTQLVEVHVDNPTNSLVPGMYAEVSIVPLHPARTLHIPGTALIVDALGTRVAIVRKDKTIHMQKVVVGRDFGTQVEILKGLRGKETLVNTPADTLEDGAKVDVLAKAPTPAKGDDAGDTTGKGPGAGAGAGPGAAGGKGDAADSSDKGGKPDGAGKPDAADGADKSAKPDGTDTGGSSPDKAAHGDRAAKGDAADAAGSAGSHGKADKSDDSEPSTGATGGPPAGAGHRHRTDKGAKTDKSSQKADDQ